VRATLTRMSLYRRSARRGGSSFDFSRASRSREVPFTIKQICATATIRHVRGAAREAGVACMARRYTQAHCGGHTRAIRMWADVMPARCARPARARHDGPLCLRLRPLYRWPGAPLRRRASAVPWCHVGRHDRAQVQLLTTSTTYHGHAEHMLASRTGSQSGLDPARDLAALRIFGASLDQRMREEIERAFAMDRPTSTPLRGLGPASPRMRGDKDGSTSGRITSFPRSYPETASAPRRRAR